MIKIRIKLSLFDNLMKHAWNSELERKQIKDLQFKNLEPVKVRQHGLFGKQYDHSKT